MPLSKLIQLRRELHANPELSNKETETAKRIGEFMRDLHPDRVIDLGKTGKAFVFAGTERGKTILFRAELDAIKNQEINDLDYCSKNSGVGHLCGHDGHMAILAGLAQKISNDRPKKGKVVLLFQPAEECEQGARDVVEDPNFKSIEPDYVFALHNIPGEEKHKILIKEGSFSAASKGMTIKLRGKSSHAAEPEKGISPANAISKIISEIHQLRENQILFNDLILLTIIHIEMGEIAFGTNPGYGEVRITLRAMENGDMDILTHQCEDLIRRIANKEKLDYDIEYCEVFPANENDAECCYLIEKAAQENGLNTARLENPYRWSEDFAYFTSKYKGALFGLGAGTDQAALHHPNYDFPDEIIETGVNIFYSIYQQINFILGTSATNRQPK